MSEQEVRAEGVLAGSPRRPSRVLDTLSMTLVLGALGVVLLSALPSIFRATGIIGQRPPGDAPRAGRVALPPSSMAPTERPFFGPEDDDDEPERPLVRPRKPGPDSLLEPRVHDPAPGAGESRARFGVALRKLSLQEKPGGGGPLLGQIQRGEMVMVVKEVGDDALVAYSGDDGVLMGWVKKSEIVIR